MQKMTKQIMYTHTHRISRYHLIYYDSNKKNTAYYKHFTVKWLHYINMKIKVKF